MQEIMNKIKRKGKNKKLRKHAAENCRALSTLLNRQSVDLYPPLCPMRLPRKEVMLKKIKINRTKDRVEFLKFLQNYVTVHF